MKRILCGLICVISLFCVTSEALANAQPVTDQAGLFESYEVMELQGLIEEAVDYTQLDIAVVTTDDTGGKTSVEYADDFYDENGFGIGSDYSGIIFLINMQEREVYISTTGKAIRYFTDARIESMLDDIYEYLADEDYYGSCEEFISLVKHYYDQGIPSGQYNKEVLNLGQRAVRSLKRLPIYILIGLVVGGIVVSIMVAVNKGKKTVDKNTYAVQNGFNLTNQNDRFVTVVHTHRRINTNSGGGGGSGRSSVHTGSSGRSHGGGGRGF